jgi:YidC/Oxa1 family membrane protein insertase
MESQRSFLFIALMVVTYLLFTQWQLENAPVNTTQPIPTQITAEQNSTQEFIPESSQSVRPMTDKVRVASQKFITVTTDVLSVQINPLGGDIVHADLLAFNTEQGNGIPFTLLQNGNNKYVAQSGLIGAQGIDKMAGRPLFSVPKTDYILTDNQPLIVDMYYQDKNKIGFTKRFTFLPSSYKVSVDYIINNQTDMAASVQMYGQLKQSTYSNDSGSGLLPTYRGAAYSHSEDPYEKYGFDDIAETNLKVSTNGGWVAMLEHYFVSAWVPNKNEVNLIYSRYSKQDEAVIGFKAPTVIVEPRTEGVISAIFYVGPKDQDSLEAIEESLDLTIDYGFLSMISQPLFNLLIWIQSFTVNWGVAIIIITLIVKGGMYPLSKAQYSSMAKMRELAPKMAKLKERYGDDRQKMSQATMEMYKKEKVNPAGGCLPLLIQMPIFLALYWVFLESVELRHAPFGLWLQDLSAKDPYYILPILMGVSMFVMQKMQPMTIQDPMQQKIMQYMPVMFTVFFFWFPSGLVLYWLVSNLISIVQMKIIFTGIEKEKIKAAK